MEYTLASLIGIALATMFFGYFFGLFEGRAQGYRRRRKEEPLEPELRPPTRQTAPAAPAQKATSAQAAQTNVWLEVSGDQNGQPQLNLDGQRVNTARLTGDQHRRLIQLMVMMRPWVEGNGPGTAAPSAAESPEAHARSAAEAGAARTQQPATNLAMKVPASAAGSSAATALPDASAPSSMVAQIDAILQARLQGTPLESRGIRLAESLDGGALVFVGRQTYPGVADVPDPDVQSAIHAAIAEWEKKYTPG
jgi:hypothetical protein